MNEEGKVMEKFDCKLGINGSCCQGLFSDIVDSHQRIINISTDLRNLRLEFEKQQQRMHGEGESNFQATLNKLLSNPMKQETTSQSMFTINSTEISNDKSDDCYNDSGVGIDIQVPPQKLKNTKTAARKSVGVCKDGGVCADKKVQPKVTKNTKTGTKKTVNACKDGGKCMNKEVQSKVTKNTKAVTRKSVNGCNAGGVCVDKEVQSKETKTTSTRRSVRLCSNGDACDKEVQPKETKNTGTATTRKSVNKICPYDKGARPKETKNTGATRKSVGECNKIGSCNNKVLPKEKINATATRVRFDRSLRLCNNDGACKGKEDQPKDETNKKSASNKNDNIPNNGTKTKRSLYTSGDPLTEAKQVLVDVKKKYKVTQAKKDIPKKVKTAEIPKKIIYKSTCFMEL